MFFFFKSSSSRYNPWVTLICNTLTYTTESRILCSFLLNLLLSEVWGHSCAFDLRDLKTLTQWNTIGEFLTFLCHKKTWQAVWDTASKRDEWKTHYGVRDHKRVSNNGNHPNKYVRGESYPYDTNQKRKGHVLLAGFFLYIWYGEVKRKVDWKA